MQEEEQKEEQEQDEQEADKVCVVPPSVLVGIRSRKCVSYIPNPISYGNQSGPLRHLSFIAKLQRNRRPNQTYKRLLDFWGLIEHELDHAGGPAGSRST